MTEASTDPWSVLSAKQQEVARAFVAAREAERKHLVIYLSGAHAYGFPSPDSDLDLKCVHIAPTGDLVGLSPSESDPADQIEVIDGVEVDYGSNELGAVLRGTLKGNGNYIERLLGELVLGGDRRLLDEARALIKPALSRRSAKHYGGFATSQLRAFDDKPSAKKALYVLRTAASGRHLMATGELVTDVGKLGEFVPPEITELIAIKQAGEQTLLDPAQVSAWRPRLVVAIDAVDNAWPSSVLPVDPPAQAVADLDAWLREVRRKHW